MTILVIAEHNNQHLALTTLNTITAALQLGEVDVLVAGFNADTVVEEIKALNGVGQVLLANAQYYQDGLAEEIAPLIVSIANEYSHIVVSASAYGKNLLPRVAAQLDIPQISDVIEIIDKDTFVHPIYAGNALETVKVNQGKVALSIRATAFDPVLPGGSATVKALTATAEQKLSRFVSKELIHSDRPDLSQAKVVVSGGRGLGSKEQFDALLTPLADALNAAIGSSRSAVDAEFAQNDTQVGQTGKVVAPELYIAVAISGAIQHVAGMQDSKVIVAINKDPDAPIFNIADYGLVADLFTAVPELTAALKS